MNSSRTLKYSVQLTRLRKMNSIQIGRRFSTDTHLLQKYSRVAGIAGAGIISLIVYGLTSDFKAYAYKKKKVS